MSNSKFTTENIVTCVVYVLIGVLLCALRMGMLDILMTIIGVLFICAGIYDIVMSITKKRTA